MYPKGIYRVHLRLKRGSHVAAPEPKYYYYLGTWGLRLQTFQVWMGFFWGGV